MKKLLSKLFRKDRRKFQRFIVEAVTPIFKQESQPEEAIVENISIDGICIKYSGEKEITDNEFDLDIRASDGFYLGNMTVERKSDAKIPSNTENRRSYRRVRGRFIRVSNVQK